jgi:PAS domain S-box-containing protein
MRTGSNEATKGWAGASVYEGDHGSIVHTPGTREELTAILDAVDAAIYVKDIEGRITFWNKGCERTYGWNAHEALGCNAAELLFEEPEELEQAQAALQARSAWQGEMLNRTKDFRELIVEAHWTLVRDAQGQPAFILAFDTEITEKKKLEVQRLRTQRIESIGTLANGIAHDLNNVFSPILTSLETLKEVASNEEQRTLLTTLRQCAQRGADLVRQVLSFSCGADSERMGINLAHLGRDIRSIARHTFPKNIRFELHAPNDLWAVYADPTQLHQVMMNLCVNAVDAMPQGGRLTLKLRNVVLDDLDEVMIAESKPGAYVLAEVHDTGPGIPPEIRDRIFEPFFTTKKAGKGSGLGLSTVLGIVRAHGGFIRVQSNPGEGAKFQVYLPASPASASPEADAVQALQLRRGKGELVLLVDDDEAVREVAKDTLERYGYRVLAACHGAEAVALYAKHEAEIAVVLLDMVMPVMDGAATILALKSMNPAVRIIASSGAAHKLGQAEAANGGALHFLSKPYTAEKILQVVASALTENAHH